MRKGQKKPKRFDRQSVVQAQLDGRIITQAAKDAARQQALAAKQALLKEITHELAPELRLLRARKRRDEQWRAKAEAQEKAKEDALSPANIAAGMRVAASIGAYFREKWGTGPKRPSKKQ